MRGGQPETSKFRKSRLVQPPSQEFNRLRTDYGLSTYFALHSIPWGWHSAAQCITVPDEVAKP